MGYQKQHLGICLRQTKIEIKFNTAKKSGKKLNPLLQLHHCPSQGMSVFILSNNQPSACKEFKFQDSSICLLLKERELANCLY